MPEFPAQQANTSFFSQGHLEPQELQGKRETLVSWAWLETRAQQGRRVTRETKGTCLMMYFLQVRGWRSGCLPGWMDPELGLASSTKAAPGLLSLAAYVPICFSACFRVLCFQQGENHACKPNVCWWDQIWYLSMSSWDNAGLSVMAGWISDEGSFLFPNSY